MSLRIYKAKKFEYSVSYMNFENNNMYGTKSKRYIYWIF